MVNNKSAGIYLDGAANTAVDPRVFRAMRPYLNKGFVGNSHSTHDFGVIADQKVRECRQMIADDLAVEPGNVYFSSGATESNNWVIKGLAFHELFDPGVEPRRHTIVLTDIEHSSVLNCCEDLRRFGIKLKYIHPTHDPHVFQEECDEAIADPDVLLVCMMAVNNETGQKLPVNSFAARLRAKYGNKIFILSDMTQAIETGGYDLRLGQIYPRVDYMTFSSHKINGPTGVGCLIARGPVYPLIIGGSQENGKRGGTHNLAGIVGMAKAIDILSHESRFHLYNDLHRYTVHQMSEFNRRYGVNLFINARDDFTYNIISLNCSSLGTYEDFAGMLASDGIAVSAGAACGAGEEDPDGKPTPSHVLLAMGLTPAQAHMTVRISFTKDTKKSDIDALFRALSKYTK